VDNKVQAGGDTLTGDYVCNVDATVFTYPDPSVEAMSIGNVGGTLLFGGSTHSVSIDTTTGQITLKSTAGIQITGALNTSSTITSVGNLSAPNTNAHMGDATIHFADTGVDGISYIRKNNAWEVYTSSGGDVVGPASAVADNVAVFNGTTGKLIKDGGAQVSDFATSAQGALADSATQPGDNVSTLTNDAGYINEVVDDTSPVLGGELNLKNWTLFTDTIATENINAGQVVILRTAGAGIATRVDDSALGALGIAMNTATTSNAISIGIDGFLGGFSGLSDGDRLYLDAAGAGHAVASDTIKISIDPTWILLT
jgi:hypothetical protein